MKQIPFFLRPSMLFHFYPIKSAYSLESSFPLLLPRSLLSFHFDLFIPYFILVHTFIWFALRTFRINKNKKITVKKALEKRERK